MTAVAGAQRGVTAGPRPAASIVVPAHNAARTIGRCLDSLACQSLPAAYEVLVVDDGSTDGTAAVAAERGAVVLRQPVQSGPAAARNVGGNNARGEFLLFIDADCEAAPDWLAEMLRPFADASVCAVYGAYRSRQKGLVARFAQAEFEERYRRLARRESIDFLATHAAAFRREVFCRAEGFRPELRGNEDVEIAYRLSGQGYRLAFAPQAAVYHEHPSTLASYLRTKLSRGYWRTLVYARHPQKAVADSYTPPWLKLQVVGLLASGCGAVATAFRPQLALALALLVVLTLATTLPLAAFAGRKGVGLALAAPWLSLLRSAALGLGVAAGGLAVAARWLVRVPWGGRRVDAASR